MERELGALADGPAKRSSAITVMAVGSSVPIVAKTCSKSSVPSRVQIIMIPSPKPKSPTRLTMNAFLAAPAAEGFLYQKPISSVAAQADRLPADVQHQEVVAQDQQQHAEHEEVQVGEEAPQAAVAVHVADRVDVDQQPDRC